MAPTKVDAAPNGHAVSHGISDKQAAQAPLKGPGLDHRSLISRTALLRPQSPIRSLFPAEKEPGMISFLAGKPNATTFPFAEFSLTLKPDAVAGTRDDGSAVKLAVRGDELTTALQYGSTPGLEPLVSWLIEWQSRFCKRRIVKPDGGPSSVGNAPPPRFGPGHNPWTIQVGNGSQDFLTKVLNTLLDPGDACLVERPMYAGVLPNLAVLEANVVAVEADEEGMSPVSLRQILTDWATADLTRHLKFPKFVLTTPTGSNPSGTTASEQRKREVLQVVREFGLLLIEDDPYVMLAFAGLGEETPETRKRCPTYFEMENEGAETWGTGYVVRLDSFSKVLSAGIRLGFLSGPPSILHYVEVETAVSSLQPSGVTQVIALKLLQHWGIDGYMRHGDAVATFYRDRRDNFEQKARAVLGADASKGQRSVATWVTPVAGMFLWLRLKLPPTREAAHGDSYALIREKARANGVLALPGVSFMPDGRTTCYVRTSFSIIPEQDVEEGLRRLRAVIEAAWREVGSEVPADDGE